ncbi:CbrC family protein [Streptomyces sp. NPDC047023]|uniref:CbrC family protein n=1 Tax=Streptomyces sp. NPDC047023 TaxID=3155139 RepID=UPI0033DF151F
MGSRFYPRCIPDGKATERSEGEFPDTTGLDGVSKDVLHEATRRTSGFHARQHPRWLVHCRTAAAFVGEVGYTELAARLALAPHRGPTRASMAGITTQSLSGS